MNTKDLTCREVRYQDCVTRRTFFQHEEHGQAQLETVTCTEQSRGHICPSGRHPVERRGSWVVPNPWYVPAPAPLPAASLGPPIRPGQCYPLGGYPFAVTYNPGSLSYNPGSLSWQTLPWPLDVSILDVRRG